MKKLFRYFFPSRKQSLLFILYGKKPSLLRWHVFRHTGHFYYAEETKKWIYLQPYWFFHLTWGKKLSIENTIGKTVNFKSGKITIEERRKINDK